MKSKKIVNSQRQSLTSSKGWAIYLLYLVIFFATWTMTNADYPKIGKTVESLQLHYALPTLLASAAVIIALSYYGWWKITLFDTKKSGPKWTWLGPIVMLLLIVAGMFHINIQNLTVDLVLWGMLGSIGVGFGEEMITRGALLVGLRTKYTETKVWLMTTIAFATLHLPNIFFGLAPPATMMQFLLTFIVGSLLYSARRLSGTLIIPMVLHGLWDCSVFLQSATGSPPLAVQLIIYPVAIICAVAVIQQNRQKKAVR